MNKYILNVIILLSIPFISFSQNKVSGFVYDKNTGETLVGANIYGTRVGTGTNGYGYFSIFTKEKKLQISYVGYKTKTIGITTDTIVKIYLVSTEQLNEVIVTDNVEKRGELNSFEIKASTIASLPTMLGDPDIFKSIQLLPGVAMGSDGGSDFYVRGGSKDQNLIMIDDVPIYNTTHTVGFFSAINNEVVKDVKLYKGAFPARYGGRTSSVLDIRTREGNTKQFNSSISVSPFIFQSTVEVPIVKNTSALLLSYRHSTFDIFAKMIDKNMPVYGFYDSNIKYHHKLGDKDVIFAGFYIGADKYKSEYSEEGNTQGEESKYGNIVASLRWNHIFNNSIFMNTTLAYNIYDFFYMNYAENTIQDLDKTYKNTLESRFGNTSDNYRLKSDFDYKVTSVHNVQFGASVVLQKYNPYNIYKGFNGDTQTSVGDTVSQSIINFISRVYIEDQIKLNKLKLNVGTNLSMTNTGDTNFFVFEPRLSIVYSLTDRIKLSSSYSRMSQNLHLVTQSGPLLPEDLWYPSTDSIPPVKSNQFTTEVNYKNKNITIAVEGFYKHQQNVTEKRFSSRGESALNLIETGIGESYGLETMFVLNFDRLMFNINYTWSRSLRLFDNLNFGKEFPFMYDRPHDLKAFGIYKLSKKWKISTVATYKSGNATTFKQSTTINGLEYQNILALSGVNQYYFDYYGGRNSYRLPNYFRWDIDLSYSYEGNWGRYVLKFGVYNLTNHHNAYKLSVDNGKIVSENLVPLMPYISYSWRLR